MKAFKYLLTIVIFAFSGCISDDILIDDAELKKASIRMPMKAECKGAWNLESDLIYYYFPGENVVYTIPSIMQLSGTGTHMGEIDAKKSYVLIISIDYFVSEDGHQYLFLAGVGTMASSNGNGFEFQWHTQQSVEDGTFFGKMELIPETGTGKFEGYAGIYDITDGQQDNKEISFKLNCNLCYLEKINCK